MSIEFSPEQQQAIDKYLKGENIFITGPGGSGKSAVIRYIYADAINNKKSIQVTALTGCAAVLLNCKAKTLHSWAGVGLGTAPIDKIIEKINKNRRLSTVWRATNILVVDEVSMLSLKLFEKLNTIGQIVRRNMMQPFGGIQLIFSGDFYQLPPIGDKQDIDSSRFCFESELWNYAFKPENQISLTKIFRQTDDLYTTILNQIREGRFKRSTINVIANYIGRNKVMNSEDDTEPPKLYPKKERVIAINNERMELINEDVHTYTAQFVRTLALTTKEERLNRAKFSDADIETELEYMSNNLMCEKELVIKKGAQVMCIINILNSDESIKVCNGSQGKVIGYCEISGAPKVKYTNGVEMIMTMHTWKSDKIPGIGIAQIPLLLSWAITIHKSQGLTLEEAEIDAGSEIFESGQTYVALSRVKSLDGLYLTAFDPNKIRSHPKVRKFYADLKQTMSMHTTSSESDAKMDSKIDANEISLSQMSIADENVKKVVVSGFKY